MKLQDYQRQQIEYRLSELEATYGRPSEDILILAKYSYDPHFSPTSYPNTYTPLVCLTYFLWGSPIPSWAHPLLHCFVALAGLASDGLAWPSKQIFGTFQEFVQMILFTLFFFRSSNTSYRLTLSIEYSHKLSKLLGLPF